MAYLKKVVIEDKLSIADELEAQMQYNIDQYQCEWKTTIENPERLKRFKHFINSDQRDDNLAYVAERGQVRPAFKTERESRIELVELAD